MSVKVLTEHHLELLSLKGGNTDSSESIHVKMPNCWKSHVAAHITFDSTKISTIHRTSIHKSGLLHVLLKIVVKCLVTWADTARDSKPIMTRSHKPISALM